MDATTTNQETTMTTWANKVNGQLVMALGINASVSDSLARVRQDQMREIGGAKMGMSQDEVVACLDWINSAAVQGNLDAVRASIANGASISDIVDYVARKAVA